MLFNNSLYNIILNYYIVIYEKLKFLQTEIKTLKNSVANKIDKSIPRLEGKIPSKIFIYGSVIFIQKIFFVKFNNTYLI